MAELDPQGTDFNLLGRMAGFFGKWQWNRDSFFHRPSNIGMTGRDTPLIEIDCNDSLNAYINCPHFRAVIDKKAEMFANGEWKCVDIDDEESEYPDDEGLKLLNNPNPLQSREDFLFAASFYKSLYSNNFIRKIQGSVLVAPKVLWHLPSGAMRVKMHNMATFFDQYELDGIIKSFEFYEGGRLKEYTTKEIIYKAENFSFEEGKGLSKIPSLKLPINNLVASLKTRNVLTVNFGVKGFVSPDGGDVVGRNTIKTNERSEIEKEFERETNLFSSDPKIKIVNMPVKFIQMSGKMTDMKLLESEEADFKTICGIFGMRHQLFPFVNNVTFDNQEMAEKGTYQNTIRQDADSFAGIMTAALKPKERRKYILCYDYLPIMKEDEKAEAETDKIETEIQEILYNNGVISAQAFADNTGNKLTGDGIKKSSTTTSIKTTGGGSNAGTEIDSLGKIPLALQQLALARERANTANDAALSKQLSDAMDRLTAQMVATLID